MRQVAWILTIALLLAAVAVHVSTGGERAWAGKPGERAEGPAFKSSGYSLVFGKLKTTGEVELKTGGNSKYTFQAEGSLEVPAKEDVVAVTKSFAVTAAVDEKNADILKPVKAAPKASYKSESYNAIHNQIGQVEISKMDLLRDGTKIKTMTLESVLVIAKARKESKLPAVVMEEFKGLDDGISVRITNLNMSASRELTVTATYKRPSAGTQNSFIEAIYAVGADGKDIGGGRWTEGDPFGKTGTMTWKFKLNSDQVHQSFRFCIVTEYTSKTISFDVKGIFSQ